MNLAWEEFYHARGWRVNYTVYAGNRGGVRFEARGVLCVVLCTQSENGWYGERRHLTTSGCSEGGFCNLGAHNSRAPHAVLHNCNKA